MKKTIKLTESDLESIIKKVLINEQSSATREKELCPIQCKKKVLGKGNAGEDVKMIQNALANCGFNKENFGGGMKAGCGEDYTKCDGKFNTETAKAVREFQKSVGITMDGLVGPKTLAALTKSPGKEPCLAPIKCNCKKKTDKISDQEQSVTDGGGNSGNGGNGGNSLNDSQDVKVGCKKSMDCFKKHSDGNFISNACGLAKCLGICLPKGMCSEKIFGRDCTECPEYRNEMPGVGVDYKKKRSPFIQACIDNKCTKVVV